MEKGGSTKGRGTERGDSIRLTMRQTQRKWVEQQFKEHGEITRNQCLQNYISRLGAIIYGLKQDGWVITSSRRGKDYVYTLGEAPKQKISEFEPIWEDGRIVSRREVVKYV